jgi:hypothetical protein
MEAPHRKNLKVVTTSGRARIAQNVHARKDSS